MKKMHRKSPSSFSAPDHQKGFSSIIHKHSTLITKRQPPKIRVIHIIPPEIIKTDITNFRNLVQRLTGRTSSTAKIRANKCQRSPISSSYQNTRYLMGTYNGSSNIRFDPNHTRLLLDDPYHKQCNLSGEYDHQVSTTDGFYQNGVWNNNNSAQPEEVRLIKTEEEEMVVEAEWGMKEKTDTWFCSDGFLQEIEFL